MVIESEASGDRQSSRRTRRGQPRHQCSVCRSRRALFQYRGEVRADRDHNLCFQCFRSELNRQRARRLAAPRRLGDVGKAVWGATPLVQETAKCA